MVHPKVWMIISSFHPAVGGAEVQVQRLSKALLEKGWETHVLTRRHIPGFRDLQQEEIVNSVPVTRLYSRGKGKIGIVLYLLGGLWYLLHSGWGSIYHAHGEGTPAWMAVLAAKLFNGRSLIKLRTGVYVYQRQYFRGIAGWQFRQLLRFTDQIVVVNQEVREWLIEVLGISTKKIVLVPNSVNKDEFFPVSKKEKISKREKLNLPLDKNIFLYVGRLNFLKGVDILLQAWNEIPVSFRRKALLLLVGEGPEYQKLEEICKKLKISNSVRMIGVKKNVFDYYWSADVFVLPSRTEGLSNAMIEAMACGLPSVVTAVGGGVDLIADGENGYLAVSEDYASLANKLVKAQRDRDQWPEMGVMARKTVLEGVDLETIVAQFHYIYRDLLQMQ